METRDNLPIIHFESLADWRRWLVDNPANTAGLWLKISKKNSGCISVSYPDAVDEAICFGWIDGQKQKYDDKFYLQRFTPRRPKSIWSKVNVAKVASLISSGRMQPAGLAAVDVAKANGEWDRAYDAPSASAAADDFLAVLNANPKAKNFYQTITKANKYAINWRIQAAKKPETRQAYISKFIDMLANEKTLH